MSLRHRDELPCAQTRPDRLGGGFRCRGKRNAYCPTMSVPGENNCWFRLGAGVAGTARTEIGEHQKFRAGFHYRSRGEALGKLIAFIISTLIAALTASSFLGSASARMR